MLAPEGKQRSTTAFRGSRTDSGARMIDCDDLVPAAEAARACPSWAAMSGIRVGHRTP